MLTETGRTAAIGVELEAVEREIPRADRFCWGGNGGGNSLPHGRKQKPPRRLRTSCPDSPQVQVQSSRTALWILFWR